MSGSPPTQPEIRLEGPWANAAPKRHIPPLTQPKSLGLASPCAFRVCRERVPPLRDYWVGGDGDGVASCAWHGALFLLIIPPWQGLCSFFCNFDAGTSDSPTKTKQYEKNLQHHPDRVMRGFGFLVLRDAGPGQGFQRNDLRTSRENTADSTSTPRTSPPSGSTWNGPTRRSSPTMNRPSGSNSRKDLTRETTARPSSCSASTTSHWKATPWCSDSRKRQSASAAMAPASGQPIISIALPRARNRRKPTSSPLLPFSDECLVSVYQAFLFALM